MWFGLRLLSLFVLLFLFLLQLLLLLLVLFLEIFQLLLDLLLLSIVGFLLLRLLIFLLLLLFYFLALFVLLFVQVGVLLLVLLFELFVDRVGSRRSIRRTGFRHGLCGRAIRIILWRRYRGLRGTIGIRRSGGWGSRRAVRIVGGVRWGSSFVTAHDLRRGGFGWRSDSYLRRGRRAGGLYRRDLARGSDGDGAAAVGFNGGLALRK